MTEDRIIHFAHVLTDAIWKKDLVDFTNDDEALREVKRILKEYFSVQESADEIAKHKIFAQKKAPPIGSKDWEVLYNKYLSEELKKRGF